MSHGGLIDAEDRASAEGPDWRRALDDRYYIVLLDDRYYVVLLDEETRTVQVAVLHPSNLPEALDSILPSLPSELLRSPIDALVRLRLPTSGG